MPKASRESAPPPFLPFEVGMEGGRSLNARRYLAASQPAVSTLVLAHGAGAGQASPFMIDFATGLSSRGIDIVTFNFPYMEAGRRLGDSNAVLEASWKAVIAAVAALPGSQIYIGGKSMGGRIASQVAARPEVLATPIAGLVFLGYPLHPPGKPVQRRDRHLAAIDAPMLFVQGERDPFGTADEVSELVRSLSTADLHVVPAGNHSLETPKRGGRDRSGVWAEVQDRIVAWMAGTR